MPAARVSQRISAIAESATLAVDAKAKALKAAGRPVIGFGAGEPDFPTPGYIVQAAIEAASQPKYHRYSPAGGLPELKQAIAEKTLRDSGYKAEASQVLLSDVLAHRTDRNSPQGSALQCAGSAVTPSTRPHRTQRRPAATNGLYWPYFFDALRDCNEFELAPSGSTAASTAPNTGSRRWASFA